MSKDLTNDILARLRNGEKAEDIAQELTNSINEASKQYEEDKTVNEQKYQAVDALLKAIGDVLAVWEFDNEYIEEIEKINPEEVVKALEDTLPFLTSYMKLLESFPIAEKEESAPEAKATPKTGPKTVFKFKSTSDTSDPLEDFLNKFVR